MATIVRPAWMTDAMFRVWEEHYLEAGGTSVAGAAERATELFRESPQYDTWFPGMRREDGELRFDANPEQAYYANMAAYKNIVTEAGIDPRVFDDEYVDLLKGDTSPAEFNQRVNTLQSRIFNAGASTQRWYADNLGLNMTNEGMLAGLMSSRVNDAIFSRDITMGEIGGQATGRGYDLSTEFVGMLEKEGMDRAEASKLFGSADTMLPMLQSLARRHGDPDDDFDITEYASAMSGIQDAEQISRINRLTAQETSTFTGGSSDFTRDRSGNVAGLARS